MLKKSQVVLLFLTSVSGWAGCFDDLVRLGNVKDFWKSNKKVEFRTPRGTRHVTFGFDAEIWSPRDAISIIEKDPKALKQLQTNLKRKELLYNPWSLYSLLGVTGPDAVRQGLYRPGVNPSHEQGKLYEDIYTFADISLKGLDIIGSNEHLKDLMATSLVGPVNRSLETRGIPVAAKIDKLSGLHRNRGVELVQDGTQDTPANFMKVIDGFLYKETNEPQTHYHLGFPTSAISNKEMMLMGRALEAKLVIDELMTEINYAPGDTFHPDDQSVIGTEVKAGSTYRGIVRVETQRWKKPFAAHDVEIRQWMGRDHARELMHYMIELGLNAKRLRDTSDFTGTYIPYSNPSNLQNTLQYLHYLLRDRTTDPAKLAYLDQLRTIAAYINSYQRVDEHQRQSARGILRKLGLDKGIGLEVFMRKPGEK